MKRLVLALYLASLFMSSTPVSIFAADARPIKVGLLAPLTGPIPDWGKKQAVGAALAVEKINQRGGVMGVPVEVVVRDTGGDPEQALALYRSMAAEDGVLAAIGPLFSNEFETVAAHSNEMKLAAVATASALPGLSDLEKRPYAFRMTVTSEKKEGPLAKAWVDSHGIKSVVVFYDSETAVWETVATKLWPRIMKDLNVDILNRDDPISFPLGQQDFGEIVKKASAYRPDGICISALPEEGGLLIKEIRRQGMKQPILGASALANPKVIEIAGDASEGLWSTSLFYPEDPNPKVRDYVNEFKERCRKEYPSMNCDPEQYDQVVYDITLFLADIMKKKFIRNDPLKIREERDRIRDGLADMGVWRGTAGMMAFDEKGDGIRTVHILKVQDGMWRPAY